MERCRKGSPLTRRPEILAPAGDRDALAAALAAGADAVYFGLDDGFNARARAANFPSDDLEAVIAWIHRAGVRAYITLNTLVFEPELGVVEELVRRVAASGADAIIVQDPAVALIARAVCPALEVHASTQMTVSSPLAASFVGELGLTRIVAPRELSVDELRTFTAGTPIPLEVFVHGALCVAWSGQCLSSEAWGGRSANRGQCAQACRLPYTLVVDGAPRDLGDVEHLLSPKDLVGLPAVPDLASIGIASLKIEGRLKGPAYVAATVARYRRAVDPSAALTDAAGRAIDIPLDDPALHVAYSRGISSGFLAGTDHQTLVEGRFPRHRGLPLGRVVRVDGDTVLVVRDAGQRPVTGGRAVSGVSGDRIPGVSESRTGHASSDDRIPGVSESRTGHASSDGRIPSVSSDASPDIAPVAGMGVVFDHSQPEDREEGGPIFGVEAADGGWRLRFGVPGPDLANVEPGDFVWVSSDPRVTRAGDRATEVGRGVLGRMAVDLDVAGVAGEPLVVTASIQRRDGSAGPTARATTAAQLAPARGTGITHEMLVDKLAAFGGTPFHLRTLTATALAGNLHIPVSELKDVRRRLVADLDAAVVRVDRTLAPADTVAATLERIRRGDRVDAQAIDPPPVVVPLCRDDAQLDAVLEAGACEVELDWMELVGLAKAVERAKQRGARVGVATVRVQKPGEERIDAHLARLEPAWVLVRSWGSLAYFRTHAPEVPLHGDFSLNVASSVTAGWVLARGLATVTAAHDLDRVQLLALLDAAPRGRIAVTVHHHIPTFHTEHCVYAHLLSHGRDYRSCGRPCEEHRVALRDRVGLVHPVIVDVGCRNTVFNAQAQSAASAVPELLARGVRRFRVELVRETGAEAAALYGAYTALVAGTASPADVVRRVAVHEQFGVTRGTMRTLTVLR